MTTANSTVITAEELSEKNITNLVEALNLISGINFTSNGGIGQLSSIKMRGMDSKSLLILIDGVRYNDITSLSGANFEHIMIDDIKQIEIIKGAQSGVWGADASSGVINIITKTPKKGYTQSLNISLGSFSTRKASLTTTYKNDKYFVKLNALKYKTNGFTAYAKNGDNIDNYEDDGYSNNTYSFKLGYTPNKKDSIILSHKMIQGKTKYEILQQIIINYLN